MPITTSARIVPVDQERFHEIDRRVTGIAFEIHNDFGRYVDERIYQKELTKRCEGAGLRIEPELHIQASLADFNKDYFADHLVNEGVVVETKAVEALHSIHKGQALNYLFLCGLQHATLLNFRTDRVQHEFVSTQLTSEARRNTWFVTDRWKPLTPRCEPLVDLVRQFINEWGAYLDGTLYRDALTHFLGGKDQILRNVEFRSGGSLLGVQPMHLLSDDVAFSVTTITNQPESLLDHQRRFLRHTPLRALQWINLNHSRIEFTTIQNQ